MNRARIIVGDARERLAEMEPDSVHCVVTSPPYWGLRAYNGGPLELGLEERADCLGWATGEPCGECWVCHQVDVFRHVRRVLRPDGTLWVVLGDSYVAQPNSGSGKAWRSRGGNAKDLRAYRQLRESRSRRRFGMARKNLVGIPERFALALQADRWIWRSRIAWVKNNPKAHGWFGRPQSAHDHVLMFARVRHYRCNRLREPNVAGDGVRDVRDVWVLPTGRFAGEHHATFPPELAERCIRLGSDPGDTVLDPYGGSGTTGLVAAELGRDAVLIELNPDYAALARRRIDATRTPLFVRTEVSGG